MMVKIYDIYRYHLRPLQSTVTTHTLPRTVILSIIADCLTQIGPFLVTSFSSLKNAYMPAHFELTIFSLYTMLQGGVS